MKKLQRYFYLTVVMPTLMFLFVACATTLGGPTPEAQIVTGANSLNIATTLATALLRNDKITVAQAKGYRAIIGTVSSHLDTANASLLACRKRTNSTSATVPDPCRGTVIGDIDLALRMATDLNNALKAKE